VDRHQRLARAGGHRDEHLTLSAGDPLLDGGGGLHLVRADTGVHRDSGQPGQLGVEIAP